MTIAALIMFWFDKSKYPEQRLQANCAHGGSLLAASHAVGGLLVSFQQSAKIRLYDVDFHEEGVNLSNRRRTDS